MVFSVLAADVVYEVQFDKSANLDASTKEQLMKGLALKLNGSYSTTGEDKISGKALYWGIKEDNFLLTLNNQRKIIDPINLGAEASVSVDAFVIKAKDKAKPLIDPATTPKITIDGGGYGSAAYGSTMYGE